MQGKEKTIKTKDTGGCMSKRVIYHRDEEVSKKDRRLKGWEKRLWKWYARTNDLTFEQLMKEKKRANVHFRIRSKDRSYLRAGLESKDA